MSRPPFLAASSTLLLLTAVACSTPSPQRVTIGSDAIRPPDELRFVVAEAELPFGPLADPAIATDRWWGVEDGAGYRVEVPASWSGRLVMYAHGDRGDSPALKPVTPQIRRQLLAAGFAWAASTYSANRYDVRAGIEDTNALGDKTFKPPFGSDKRASVNTLKLGLHRINVAEQGPGVLRAARSSRIQEIGKAGRWRQRGDC